MRTDCTFEYKTLFGPVPSRRLGISLGVDLVCHKTCSLNCVYCECGATTHLTTERKAYVSVDLVKDELNAYLARNEKIDHITFSGSGEPTLNEGIGDVIQFLKADFPQYKVALLTNSTLLDQPTVRRQVQDADVVMASLDAGTEAGFRWVNRPHPQLDLDSIIEGVAAFRRMCRGRLVMECFLVKDANDSPDELKKLRGVFKRIGADEIFLNTLDRPGAEAWVQPVDRKRMKDISVFFEDAEIVKYVSACPATAGGHEDLLERLVATVQRRPSTARDVARVVGLAIENIQPILDQLVASNQLIAKPMERGVFYMATQSKRNIGQ